MLIYNSALIFNNNNNKLFFKANCDNDTTFFISVFFSSFKNFLMSTHEQDYLIFTILMHDDTLTIDAIVAV